MCLIKGQGHITDDRGRVYSDDPADYIELCRSCHLHYDGSMARTITDDQRARISISLKGRPRPDISAMFKGKRSESSKKGWETRRRNQRFASDTQS